MPSRAIDLYDKYRLRRLARRESVAPKRSLLLEADGLPELPGAAPEMGVGPAGPPPAPGGPGGDVGPGGAPKEAVQQYNTIWLSGKEYFDTKADELVDLPRESPDRLLVDAANGVLAQYEIKPEDSPSPDHIRDTASMLADKLDELFGEQNQGEELKAFAVKFAQSMREFHNQIEPGGGDQADAEPPPEEEAPAPPEKPEAERPNFSRDMGNELENPPAPAATRRQESVRRAFGFRDLLEAEQIPTVPSVAPEGTLHPGRIFDCVVHRSKGLANAFLSTHPDWGVAWEEQGKVYSARLTDQGRSPSRS